MNFHRTVAVSVIALSAVSLPAANAETLADAVNAALATNPGLQAQRAEADIAIENVEQARSQGRTTVDLSGSAGIEYIDSNAPFAELAGTNGDRPIASAQIQAAKPIYTGGRIRAGVRQAQAGVDAAESQYVAAEQDLILQVVTAYVDVRSDLEAVTIRENNVEVTGEQVRLEEAQEPGLEWCVLKLTGAADRFGLIDSDPVRTVTINEQRQPRRQLQRGEVIFDDVSEVASHPAKCVTNIAPVFIVPPLALSEAGRSGITFL